MEAMEGSLFGGLPAPARPPPPPPSSLAPPAPKDPKAAPKSAIKGAIKSATSPPSKRKAVMIDPEEKVEEKATRRVSFKSDESEVSKEQIKGAMGKIASHIGNPGKFSKASNLAVQLLEAGNVTSDTADAFFEILSAAMTVPSQAIDSKLWMDYRSLFSSVMEKVGCFGTAQQTQIDVWELWAVSANDFRTDDTFVFSKASSRVRHSLDSLPQATEEDEFVSEESGRLSMQSGCELPKETGGNNSSPKEGGGRGEKIEANENVEDGSLPKVDSVRGEKNEANDPNENLAESDPFGLDALVTPKLSKKEERLQRKRDGEVKKRNEDAATLLAQKDAARLLNQRREALIACLRIAADRYKLPWAQTIIDILVKHAYDAVSKFTGPQRKEIRSIWATIREQLVSRKNSKFTSSGKLDVTSFEHFQSVYAAEHISIRRAVGSSGERSAEQWLG